MWNTHITEEYLNQNFLLSRLGSDIYIDKNSYSYFLKREIFFFCKYSKSHFVCIFLSPRVNHDFFNLNC